MSHLYIHIPFCHSKCPYCDFFSVATKKWHGEFVQALCREAKLRKDEIKGKVETIYFGGGTPSLLTEQEFSEITLAIQQHFSIDKYAEITLEANPDDVTPDKLVFWKSQGVNRLSIGTQSFDNKELQYLGRRHTANRSRQALKDAVNAGFDNISADLIHGLPEANIENLFRSIEELSQTGVKHLSMYSLTVEKGTILENHIKKGVLRNINEDEQAETYLRAVEKAESCGFIQYEISNFCVPGFESKHNSAYWKSASYLGLGPSAHSFDGKKRSWNVSDIPQYITGINEQKPVFESETLSATDIYNEFLLTRLRMVCGIQLEEMKQLFGESITEEFIEEVKKLNVFQYLHITEKSLALTRSGLLFADRIISELMK
ncbi:MAG TPA: radical SAM family heme chaperone HemW [Bacteroidales bacterium]|nr:radical SAM family heme chaperone HemW [Bacteroidales bacterium]